MMKSRFLFLAVCMLVLNACGQRDKSKETLEQSVDAYFAENQDLEQRIENSLMLVNKALEYDERNFSAYDHKMTLLFHKRDLQGLLETNAKMIELRPEQPYYILQRALYREVYGDSVTARQDYQRVLKEYKDLLDKNPSDFDLSLTYIVALEAAGDSIRASSVLSDLERNSSDTIQTTIIREHKRLRTKHSKKLLIKYFKGEIAYGEFD